MLKHDDLSNEKGQKHKPIETERNSSQPMETGNFALLLNRRGLRVALLRLVFTPNNLLFSPVLL